MFHVFRTGMQPGKHFLPEGRIVSGVFTLIVLSFLISSCDKKINIIPKSDLLTMPSLSVRDFETVYTDSGRLELIMSGPLMDQYNNAESPYYEFRSGIKVLFYDGKSDPQGSVVAKYARYTVPDKLWELKDSVVVINEANDKLETEVLYWDEQKDLIYSDRFVRITNEDQIVMGTGFESDPRLNKRKIKKVSATIYLKEEE